jgi:stearoyl-CoA desaturase (delta-9 desaturase)
MLSALLPYGIVPLPLWGYGLVSFALIQLMFLGITLYLHRDQAHGGLVLHPILRHFFRFWLWFSCGTVTREWVAVHRRHHAYADVPGDPHSPVVFGLRKVVLEGYELYRAAAHDPHIVECYGRGTPNDWLERNLYGRRPAAGIALFIVALLVLFGVPAIVMIAIHLAAQPFFAGGVINGVGHHFGYRSFEMPSSATNIVPWGLLLGGEELHNNHHAFPGSARFSVQAWEVDAGWLWIRLFRSLGLARVQREAPHPQRGRLGRALDADTARALVSNRLHVLRDYARRVVRPVCRELARHEPDGALPRGMPTLLIRHRALLAAEARAALSDLLSRYEVLRAVVEFRDSLQRACGTTHSTPAAAALQLRDWCLRAEASGIRALREFARGLRADAAAPA